MLNFCVQYVQEDYQPYADNNVYFALFYIIFPLVLFVSLFGNGVVLYVLIRRFLHELGFQYQVSKVALFIALRSLLF